MVAGSICDEPAVHDRLMVMRTDLPEGTVTLLLTDIEGSTRLLHALGSSRYADLQSDHRDLLRRAFRDHGGVEVDTQGDAFFAAFPTALGCLRAAVQAQRALATHTWPEGRECRVRMGMHTGEPERTEEGYIGMDVHATARICSAGAGGQILMSNLTAELLDEQLESENLIFRDLGENRLKDLEGPQRLHQVVIPELPSDFAPLRTQETRPNNLPVPPTPFVGRAAEVAEIRDRMLDRSVRVLTLTGPGGMGKSRLSLRVAGELLHEFEDGAFFVPLAPVRHPRLVIPAIARALDIREGGGKTLLETLQDYLQDKELLLVLDNFEHVRAAARDLAGLMSQAPLLKVLITSREALRLSGERDFPVPPLELPPAGARLGPRELDRYAAITLFCDRADGARAGFVLDADNADTVVQICRRLDGLPLAIELAAARIRNMSADELLEALAERLSVLTDGPVDLPERQQTLRDAIAWSFDLLEPEEQAFCRRLAVFAGGCEAAVARKICDLEDQQDAIALLDSLVAKSLVGISWNSGRGGAAKVVTQTGNDEPRYTMLETIREYASELLEAAGELDTLRERHRDWCLQLVQDAEPELRGSNSEQWLEALEKDLDNLRAAIGRCLEGGDQQAEVGLQITNALLNFMYEHGHISEMRDWLESGLNSARQAPEALRARTFYSAAGLARHQGQLEEAEIYCEDALELFRKAGDQSGIARALGELGAILQRKGQLERSELVLNEALSILRELDEPERLSFTLVVLGALQHIQDRLDEAAQNYQESLEIGRARQDQHAMATALVNLGEIAQQKAENIAAREMYAESLAIFNQLNMDITIAYCLEVIAGIDVAEGEPLRAARLFGAAEILREEIGTPVESFNRERYDKDLASVRDALDTAIFDEARSNGRALSRVDVVALALGEETSDD